MLERHLSAKASVKSVEAEPKAAGRGPCGYQTPTIVEVGKAIDQVQSYSWGAYSDGYTGYYWDR